uniref:ATP synthase complex subunit 8 n=1 Tax=Henricia pachyderma TaxID=60579 RepID=A0A6M9ZZ26_9ECHI|nr:ATP synthase F0 subunit 8 [Henricia pachyderma]
MPQLNLTWWIVNFIIAWASFFIVSSIIINTNIDSITPYNNTSHQYTLENEWNWH